MTINRATITTSITRLTEAMERDFDMLNTADGALGDGDLGITMLRGMRAINEDIQGLPDDLGLALFQCAKSFTKSSGSSYGTLLATGLMAVAKTLKGKTEIEAAQIGNLVSVALDQMQARGKAQLGGKTVLDSLDAVAKATYNKTDAKDIADAAATAVDTALKEFRNKKATIGRARIYAEKSIGLDDPGMLAMNRIIKALADRQGTNNNNKTE